MRALAWLIASTLGSVALSANAEEPALAAYATPGPGVTKVVRRGKQAQLSVGFLPVEGARAYEVQVSRALTFSHVVAGREVTASPVRILGLPPGIYFVRTRALGPAGDGAWGSVQVIDATWTHSIKRRGVSPSSPPTPDLVTEPPPGTAAVPLSPGSPAPDLVAEPPWGTALASDLEPPPAPPPAAAPAPPPAVSPAVAPAPPPVAEAVVSTPAAPAVSGPPPAGEDLALDWRAPVDQSLVEQPSIFLTGLAPAGTSLRAGDGAPIAVSGPFRIPVRLSLGRNSLVLLGERGEQKAELRRAVYYVDVAQLGAMRRRFEELKLQLHSIQVLREDLRGTILTLRARQAKHTAGSEAAADLENVEKAQLMLQDDLTATLAELDGLLRRAAAPQGR
jgi:hypothetical protein